MEVTIIIPRQSKTKKMSICDDPYNYYGHQTDRCPFSSDTSGQSNRLTVLCLYRFEIIKLKFVASFYVHVYSEQKGSD